MSDITQILQDIEQGDTQAAEQLLPLVYTELRQLAAQKMAQEKPGQTLEATALVHEAYLRLVAPAGGEASVRADTQWNSRRHFFSAAAEAMRRILVENARRKKSQKRGGDRAREIFDDRALARPEAGEDTLAIDEALAKLAESDADAAELVKLRYFAGFTMEQAAEILGVSVRKAHYLWSYARSWLRHELRGQ